MNADLILTVGGLFGLTALMLVVSLAGRAATKRISIGGKGLPQDTPYVHVVTPGALHRLPLHAPGYYDEEHPDVPTADGEPCDVAEQRTFVLHPLPPLTHCPLCVMETCDAWGIPLPLAMARVTGVRRYCPHHMRSKVVRALATRPQEGA